MYIRLKEMERLILEALYYVGPLDLSQLEFFLARKGCPRKRVTILDSLYRLQREEIICCLRLLKRENREDDYAFLLRTGKKARTAIEQVTDEDTVCREIWLRATQAFRKSAKEYHRNVFRNRFVSEHENALRNFRLLAHLSEGGCVESWRTDAFKFHCRRLRKRGMIRPDAFFSWRDYHPEYFRYLLYFFVEMELGWKSDAQVKKRLEGYIYFLLSDNLRNQKRGYSLPYCPTLLFLFGDDPRACERSSMSNAKRHFEILSDIMQGIAANMDRWKTLFACGYTHASHFTGTLTREREVVFPDEAIWYDFYRPGEGPYRMCELIPSRVRKALEEPYRSRESRVS